MALWASCATPFGRQKRQSNSHHTIGGTRNYMANDNILTLRRHEQAHAQKSPKPSPAARAPTAHPRPSPQRRHFSLLTLHTSSAASPCQASSRSSPLIIPSSENSEPLVWFGKFRAIGLDHTLLAIGLVWFVGGGAAYLPLTPPTTT